MLFDFDRIEPVEVEQVDGKVIVYPVSECMSIGILLERMICRI